MGHPFAAWRKDLRTRGFASSATGGRVGIYMTRRRGPVSEAIGAMLHRHRPEDFAVVLHVNMPLPCAEPPHDVMLLSGDLTEDGVRTDGLLSHLEPGSTTWWPVARLEEAWTRVEEHGLRWLERFSDPGPLIEYFEEEYARERATRAPGARESRMARLMRGLTGQRRSRTDLPYRQYLLWLAMLYEATGDLERARRNLESYAHPSPPVAAERARLERHRKALEGTASRARPPSDEP